MQGFKFELALKELVKFFGEEKQKKPVLFHSVRVGSFLWRLGYKEDLQIAGLLHDALEDTDMEEEHIKNLFGQYVLDIVKANSKNETLDKEHILEDVIKRCASFGKDAMIVKVSDIYDNFTFYKKEKNHPEMDRCRFLANLVFKYKKPEWNDEIFDILRNIGKTHI